MLQEYQQTLEILKNQKNNIINTLKDNHLEIANNQNLIEKLCYIDNKINEYINKIENEKYHDYDKSKDIDENEKNAISFKLLHTLIMKN